MGYYEIVKSFGETDKVVGYEFLENNMVRIYYHVQDSEEILNKDFVYLGNIKPVLQRLMRNV